MVEPPRQTLIGTILKIDDRVLIAVKLLSVKGVPRTVHRRRVGNFGSRSDRSRVELCEDRGRRNAVKAVTVIEDAKFHIIDLNAKGQNILG